MVFKSHNIISKTPNCCVLISTRTFRSTSVGVHVSASLYFIHTCGPQPGSDVKCLPLMQAHVTAGDQLVHSAFMQSLASLAVGLSLEKHLCCYPRPPHHATTDDLSCPLEWSWLAAYATTIRSAEAIASGTSFPKSFVASEFQDVGDTEITKGLVSSDGSCVSKKVDWIGKHKVWRHFGNGKFPIMCICWDVSPLVF